MVYYYSCEGKGSGKKGKEDDMLSVILTVFAILVVFVLWVILYDTHHFVVVKYGFTSGLLKKPVRLVMLSDLHNYRYGRDNTQLLAAIEEASPDAVMLVGDMITANKREKFDRTIQFLKTLKEKYSVYYAYGNHEQKISLKKERFGDYGERFEQALKETGIEPLRNGHVSIPSAGITVYGLEVAHDDYYQRFTTNPMPDGYIEGLLGKKDASSYAVLLAHNPEYFPEYAKWGADLVLSGHIHGGIIRVPFLGGVISPAIRFFPKYDGGLFHEGESDMVLSRGIGTHSPVVRLFNPAELIVVELQPEK